MIAFSKTIGLCTFFEMSGKVPFFKHMHSKYAKTAKITSESPPPPSNGVSKKLNFLLNPNSLKWALNMFFWKKL
jgi:hypothetical protein